MNLVVVKIDDAARILHGLCPSKERRIYKCLLVMNFYINVILTVDLFYDFIRKMQT